MGGPRVQTYGKKNGLAKPGEVYCTGCGTPSTYSSTAAGSMECLACRIARAEDCVVYDRDSGRGALPANLRRLVEGQNG